MKYITYTTKMKIHIQKPLASITESQVENTWSICTVLNIKFYQCSNTTQKYFWPKTKNISINLCAALMYKLFYQKKLIRRQWKFCLIRFRIISKIYRCNPFCNLKLIIICKEIQSFVNINKIKMFYLQGVQF